MNRTAANELKGEIIGEGWLVGEKIRPSVNSTGGNFSVCYTVSRDDVTAFLKVLDFDKVFGMFGGQFLDVMRETLDAFHFENQVLQRCRSKKMSKVTLLLESGIETYSRYVIPQVPYFILECAKEDIRSRFGRRTNIAFKIRSLHNICVGLNQLHSQRIAHQDLKPSNVLVYNDGVSKIADLGRAICADFEGPHSSLLFPGDRSYAPPEILYRYHHPEESVRIYCTDMYLLGSLLVFYPTGFTMNGFIYQSLPIQFHHQNWSGQYEDVKPYLQRAFTQATVTIEQFLGSIPFLSDIIILIKELCHPDINQRGYVRMGAKTYSVYRYINRLDLIARKYEYGITN